MPAALAPIHDQQSENIGCCCFKKGYLELRVDIPKTGFVPGEVVSMNLHILNHGSVPVTETRAKIIQNSTYHAYRNGHITTFDTNLVIGGGAYQESKTEVSEVIRLTQALTIEPGKEHKMSLELRIPSVTPTINQFCPIIFVTYVMQVSMETTSTFNSSVDCELPIFIGTVPIRQYLPPAYYPQDPSLPASVPTPMPGFLPYGEVTPVDPGAPDAPAIGGGVAPTLPPPYPDQAPPLPGNDQVVIPSGKTPYQ